MKNVRPGWFEGEEIIPGVVEAHCSPAFLAGYKSGYVHGVNDEARGEADLQKDWFDAFLDTNIVESYRDCS